jgi:hypothetical protein
MEMALNTLYINPIPQLYRDYAKSDEGKRMKTTFEEMIEDAMSPISANIFSIELINEMNAGIREFIIDNVDLKSQIFSSRANALKFIEQLSVSFPKPEISIESDGEIAFDWITKSNGYLSVSIGANGQINYAAIVGSNKYHGKINFDENIPEEISNIISKMY